MRQGDRFEDHLIRATRYHTVLGDCFKQLLLVKDLPNVYQEDYKSFFSLLEYVTYHRFVTNRLDPIQAIAIVFFTNVSL